MIERLDITGLVLAGGRGSRMGGVDKGLQLHDGMPLALRAMRRLAPQVGSVAISANRHLGDYAAMGAPVWPDALPDHPGPLAGMLAGLDHCTTPYLVTVPCDAPRLPHDLVARLAAALGGGDALALAATREEGVPRLQPVFCLMRASVRDSLAAFIAGGRRRVDAWTSTLRSVAVVFDDPAAFVNVNTRAELELLQRHG